MDITDKLDKYTILEEDILLEASAKAMMKSLKNKLGRMSWRQTSDFLKDNFKNFADMVITAGFEEEVLYIINQSLGTRFTDLNAIANLRVFDPSDADTGRKARGRYNEDVDSVDEGRGTWLETLTLVPFVKASQEISKVLRGTGSVQSAILYALLWVALASGKLAGKAAIRGGKRLVRKGEDVQQKFIDYKNDDSYKTKYKRYM